MRGIMRSKCSFFLSAFAAIATITLYQFQCFFRTLGAHDDIDDLSTSTTLTPIRRGPSPHSLPNRSIGAEADERSNSVSMHMTSGGLIPASAPTEASRPAAADTSILESANPTTTNVTIVCEMSGELGNHLGHIAHCAGIALWLQRHHNVSSHVAPQFRPVAGVRRWKAAQDVIRSCFPKLSRYSFKKANAKVFLDQKKEQEKLKLPLYGVNSKNSSQFKRALRDLAHYTSHNLLRRDDNTDISFPFVYSTTMSSLDFVMDWFADDIRDLFEFDRAKASCCAITPEPDETVFHFRNFGTELPGRANKLGFQELGPKQTARQLFGHLVPGDKVAIISRFEQKHASAYINALTERGLSVRFVQNQTGIQDFCFLMHAQKEIVGITISTYFKWAALLSNASRIISYSLDVPAQRRRTAYLHNFKFENPNLGRRWTFRQLKPNEVLFANADPPHNQT